MVMVPARRISGRRDHLEVAESIAISMASKTSNMEVDAVLGVSIDL
jgi:hypothetical protein